MLDEKQKMEETGKTVSKEDIDKADEKYREAVSEFSNGNFQKANELFTDAIEINPNSALFFAKRGQTFLKLKKPNACITDCTKALELKPNFKSAYENRRNAYTLLGNPYLAAENMKQVCIIELLKENRELVMSKCMKRDILDEKQKMGETGKEVSEEDIDKADEKFCEAMNENEFSTDSCKKAIELFTEAIEIIPTSLFFAHRGKAFLKLKNPDACIKDCTKALELNPDYATAYETRERAYDLLSKLDFAARDMKQGLKVKRIN